MTVELRYDDTCKNGHRDFAITAEIRTLGRRDECPDCKKMVHDFIMEAQAWLDAHVDQTFRRDVEGYFNA